MVKIAVYLEAGSKRTFVGAEEWPGWCRSGRDEAGALQALVGHGPRYARVMSTAGLSFQPPADASTFAITERLKGNITTDFGAPDAVPACDAQPVDEAGLQRFQALLNACWQAFESAVGAARGKHLRLGPRGGGRDLDGIVDHVLDAEAGYLSRIGGALPRHQAVDAHQGIERARQAVVKALASASRGEVPAQGPRGGKRWLPRYYVRRAAWHVLDHAWEVEDRVEG